MANPWDILPTLPKGDEDSEIIFTAVGRALTAWESLESQLGFIFGLLCGSFTDAPSRAYGVVASSRGRIDMLREAFRSHAKPKRDTVPGFEKFLDRVSDFGSRRNEIAHGFVTQYNFHGSWLGFYLVPASYNSRKNLNQAARHEKARGSTLLEDHLEVALGKYAYTAAQIDHYGSWFSRLDFELSGLLGAFHRFRIRDED